ncbi:acetylxylan esterase [Hymenobacter sp. GOD-10R]|uniref:acetylxylan esterase n=1 Tax=Hymenobacter sp. GOD-10R TaxID=3093922 RepID=UPI002D797A1C|nr:acetylxylan esterase [Hymenobacter sp. GOD-10R]WRQ30639.1 acetylxylan esterase [Hymenobacter sp. GOD-10R]
MRKSRFLLSICLLVLGIHLGLAQNSPAPLKLISFVLTPSAPEWKYAVNQTASVQVLVLKNDVPLEEATISYEYGPEMLDAEKKGSLTLKKGQGRIDLGTSKQPGFRQLLVKTEYQGKTYSSQVKIGFSPERITPTVELPSDFAAFWEQAKREAATVPMDVHLTYLPEHSTSTVDVYLVNLQNYQKGQRLYGFLCKPKAPGKYPVLFSPPGAGVKAIGPYTWYAEQGFISLSIEIHGISPLLDEATYKNISNAFGDYTLNRLDDRDNYYYKRVYLGCVRAIDYLCSLPEFDGRNVVVTGGSQGGALTIVTAALDKRVTALAAFYPALCDLTGYLHGRAGGWPHLLNARSAGTNNTPAKLRTIGYYDVVNFARQITVPGFYSWGYNDNTCPPTSVYAAINTIKAPKTVVISPITGHWRFEETNLASIEWLKQQIVK